MCEQEMASTDNSQYLVRFLNNLCSSYCILRENFKRCQANRPQAGNIVLRDISRSEAICEFAFSFALGEISVMGLESGSTLGHLFRLTEQAVQPQTARVAF